MIVSDAFGHFLKYCRAERHVSDSSLHKYRDCFSSWISPWFGQQEVGTIIRLKILDMRQAMMNRQLSVARQYGVMMCLKSFLKFCRSGLALPCIDPSELTLPKRKAPQVEYLDNVEIQRMLSAIDTGTFLEYARVELQFGAQTLEKYEYCLKRLARALGDMPVTEITPADITGMKSEMLTRGNGVCWQIVRLASIKRLLLFCRDQLLLQVLDPAAVTIPKRPRREVLFLTPEEVARFVAAIPLKTSKNQPHHPGIRFRALVETLLGSAMRIGEVLSLNRTSIDFERKEARVVGKGNKERTVFFTDRALYWLCRYLDMRTDKGDALFLSQSGTRLSRTDIWRPFNPFRRIAGLNKPVRPHLLRHTAATQLLFNGCPVGHIKEILGHERLETTCRYYLGLDRRAAKAAHQQYLVYGSAEQEPVICRTNPEI